MNILSYIITNVKGDIGRLTSEVEGQNSSKNSFHRPTIMRLYVNELFDDVFAPSFSCVGVNGFLKYEMDFPKK